MAYPLLIRILKIPQGVVRENNPSVSTQGTERTTTEIPNKEQIKADASGVVHKAKNIGREQIESGKQTAASQAEQFPNDSLQNRSVHELVTHIRDMVGLHPGEVSSSAWGFLGS